MKTTQQENIGALSAIEPTSADALSIIYSYRNPARGEVKTVKRWKDANEATISIYSHEDRVEAELWLAMHESDIADYQDFGDYIEVYRKRK